MNQSILNFREAGKSLLNEVILILVICDRIFFKTVLYVPICYAKLIISYTVHFILLKYVTSYSFFRFIMFSQYSLFKPVSPELQ